MLSKLIDRDTYHHRVRDFLNVVPAPRCGVGERIGVPRSMDEQLEDILSKCETPEQATAVTEGIMAIAGSGRAPGTITSAKWKFIAAAIRNCIQGDTNHQRGGRPAPWRFQGEERIRAAFEAQLILAGSTIQVPSDRVQDFLPRPRERECGLAERAAGGPQPMNELVDEVFEKVRDPAQARAIVDAFQRIDATVNPNGRLDPAEWTYVASAVWNSIDGRPSRRDPPESWSLAGGARVQTAFQAQLIACAAGRR